MQAFAISLPLLSVRTPRLGFVSPRPSFFNSAARARASFQHANNLSESVSTPAMTMTANSVENGILANLSPVDGDRIAAVRQQMEFWFSPSNLRRDWYLRRQMDEEGWLDPSVFLMFNKIKNLKANAEDIILACRTSDELEVSVPAADSFGDDINQTRVRRSPELPGYKDDDDMEWDRSFIISGIPPESTIETLQKAFQQLAPVSYLRIYRNKNFPDSPKALICFPDVNTAEMIYATFVKGAPTEFQGMTLRKRAKPTDGPSKEKSENWLPTFLICELNGLPPNWSWKKLHRHLDFVFAQSTGFSIRFLMYTGDSDNCHVTLKNEGKTKEFVQNLVTNGIEIGGTMVSVRILAEEELKEYWRIATEFQEKRNARKADALKSRTSSESVMGRHPEGVIVKVDQLDEDNSWRELKSDMSRLGTLIYLSYEQGSSTCFSRYSSPEEAASIVESLTAKENAVHVLGKQVDARVLEGDEEIEYWTQVEEAQKERRSRLNVQD